jgi:twinkle protein
MPTVDETFITDFTYQPLTVRGISEAACRRYKYGVSKYHGKPCHVANWFDDTGKIIGQKYRTDGAEQKFSTVGKVEGLFGKTLMRDAGKRVYVTEGELDCLAVSDALGNKWPVVSVPHGAGSAKKWIKKDLEWLESFEVVVLVFDSDEAGQRATAECRELFSPGKCHVAALVRKDPCDYLMANDRASLVEALWGAQKWTPAGIISGARLLEAALNRTVHRVECGWPWEPMNVLCTGLRYRELITITAGTGIGKSTFCRELAAHFLKHGETVGYIALEESPRTTALGIYGVHAGSNLVTDYTPDTRSIREAHTAWGDRLYLFDHFGSTGSDELLSRVRYLIVGLGCKIVVLDHLSIVVSGLEIDDERKAIDVIMTRLRTLVEETGCLLLVVSHLKRPPGKGHEEGEMVSLSHLRGSAAIAQLSDMVIGLERNQQDEDAEARQQVAVRVLKNRFSGRTGVAGVLSYDSETGRLTHNEHKDF